MRYLKFGLIAAVLAAVASGAATSPVHAQDFYKGKRIRLMIGNTPGGSYDIAARLVGRNLIRHIPGHPTSGLELQRIVAEMMATPKSLLDEAKMAMRYRSGYDHLREAVG